MGWWSWAWAMERGRFSKSAATRFKPSSALAPVFFLWWTFCCGRWRGVESVDCCARAMDDSLVPNKPAFRLGHLGTRHLPPSASSHSQYFRVISQISISRSYPITVVAGRSEAAFEAGSPGVLAVIGVFRMSRLGGERRWRCVMQRETRIAGSLTGNRET